MKEAEGGWQRGMNKRQIVRLVTTYPGFEVGDATKHTEITAPDGKKFFLPRHEKKDVKSGVIFDLKKFVQNHQEHE